MVRGRSRPMLQRAGHKPSVSLAARSCEAWGVGLEAATVGAIADGLGSLLRGAADLGRRAASGVDLTGRGGEHHDGGSDDGRDGAETSRVQRIRVS